jgi:hypothetical protein
VVLEPGPAMRLGELVALRMAVRPAAH